MPIALGCRPRVIIWTLLALLGLQGCGSDGDDAGTFGAEPRAVFAVIDPAGLTIYSSDIEGRDRQVVVNRPLPGDLTRARAFTVLQARMAPDGGHVAYRIPDVGDDVFLVDVRGRDPRRIIEKADAFAFAPDGGRLLYRIDAPVALEPWEESPLYGPASTWRLRTLAGGDVSVDVQDSGANAIGGWIDDSRVLLRARSNYGGYGDRLYVLNVDSGVLHEVAVPSGTQLNFVSSNADHSRTVISLLPEGYGSTWSCDIYELHDAELGPSWVHADGFDCGGIAWNGADEFLHGRGTGPNGRIDSGEISEAGYYILASVYRYSFATGLDAPVLVSNGREVYSFGGVLPGRALAISNASTLRAPQYQLELRDLDGSRPRVLAASPSEMLFIGWGAIDRGSDSR